MKWTSKNKNNKANHEFLDCFFLYNQTFSSCRHVLNVGRYEGFLSRHARVLHPNHFLFTSAKQSLSQLYGRDEHHLLNTLTEKQLERKVAICRELLAIANVVEPGLTRLRGSFSILSSPSFG